MVDTQLRVWGATAYPLSTAGPRVRLAMFAPFLATHGIALDYRPTLRDAEYRLLASAAPPRRKAAALLSSARRAMTERPDHDLLLVHRLRLLVPLPGIDPPPRLDAYDFDDALFLGSAAPVNRGFAWTKQEARRCVACLRRARLVLAGNKFLAAAARRYARRVEVVPSCIDPQRQPLRIHDEGRPVTVGWIGSPTTGPYLDPVLPQLAALNDDRLQVRFVVVGADTGWRAPWIEHRPWSLARETDDIAEFDIGIMPLPDTPWARGKCGYKLLQYFAAGVPAVSSPVGVANELVGQEHGLLASTQMQWRDALTRLAKHPDERRELGLRARAFVERSYSYQSWAPRLAELLRSLAG